MLCSYVLYIYRIDGFGALRGSHQGSQVIMHLFAAHMSGAVYDFLKLCGCHARMPWCFGPPKSFYDLSHRLHRRALLVICSSGSGMMFLHNPCKPLPPTPLPCSFARAIVNHNSRRVHRRTACYDTAVCHGSSTPCKSPQPSIRISSRRSQAPLVREKYTRPVRSRTSLLRSLFADPAIHPAGTTTLRVRGRMPTRL